LRIAAVERGAGLEIERGATKAVDHAGTDQKRVAEHEGLPSTRELDRILAERIGEQVAGMPTDNCIFQSGVLRRVRGRRARALRCQARGRIAVPAGQRADHADESVGVAEIEKRRFQLGKRLAETFEPIPCRAAHGRGERPLERRIRVYVAGPSIDIAHREAPEPRFDADGQLVAVLIIKHLVRSRRAHTNGCHGKKGNTGPAMKFPRHLPPLPASALRTPLITIRQCCRGSISACPPVAQRAPAWSDGG